MTASLSAGLAMARGRVAELPTGEGKTLAAVFPAALFALSGAGVHILTFNDYLARRDAAWMGPVFRLLGFSVGCVQEGQTPEAKARRIRPRRHLRHGQGGGFRLSPRRARPSIPGIASAARSPPRSWTRRTPS